MGRKLLQVNYKMPFNPKDMPKDKLEKVTALAVEDAKWIAAFPGLIWKIYGFNIEIGEASGTYLFKDEASLKAYLDSPIMTDRKAGKYHDAAIKDLEIKQFELDVSPVDKLTKITRGPID